MFIESATRIMFVAMGRSPDSWLQPINSLPRQTSNHKLKMSMRHLLFLCLLFATLCANQAQAQLIIANPNVKVSNVSKNDIKEVFTGGSSSLEGSHVTPILLKSGSVKDKFLSTYVGKSEATFMAGWRTLIFSGQATMPKSVDSEAAVVEFVAKTPGAIGYIDKATPHEGVNVLADK
jgi:hypothetical protein